MKGFFNKHALEGIRDSGIKFLIGDNSDPRLAPPNPFVGRYTTEEENGVGGLLIIPRSINNIFWDASIPSEQISKYNYLYQEKLGYESTLEQIIDSEVEQSLKTILVGNEAPWLFHFTNLREFIYQERNTTLFELWAKKLLKLYGQRTVLPLENYTAEEYSERLVKRMGFESCGAEISLVYQQGRIKGMTASSEGTCTLTVTGIAESSAGELKNKYGPYSSVDFTLDKELSSHWEVTLDSQTWERKMKND